MILDDKWSWRRGKKLGFLILVTVGVTIAAAILQNTKKTDIPILVLCSLLFCVILILSLEQNRIKSGILDEKANNYTRIAAAYMVCGILLIVMTLLPEYSIPILVIPVMMSLVSTIFIGFITGVFFSVLLAISGGGSVYFLSCCLLLCACGCMVAAYMEDKKNKVWCGWIILSFSGCMITIFSCLEMRQASLTYFLYGIISGIMSAVIVLFLYTIWHDKINTKKESILEDIIGEKYELVQAMQAYSKSDYEHARKVSGIAKSCAELIGANPYLAAAGGFYYRLGRLEGKPFVENGVLLAISHGFPPELTLLLGEYNGEKAMPSTLESALIHIVDNVVAKFDVFDKNTLSSSWNQDLVVYQTLNENSAHGYYDKSGLSMNMFLKIRDYLIKEAGLY